MGVTMKRLVQALAVFLVVTMIGLSGTLLAGTTGKIAGRVIDNQTGEGLPGANVFVRGTNFGAATDVEGYYTILNVPPGKFVVEVSMVGYKKVVQ